MLARCNASLAALTDADWEQTVVIDRESRGVIWANTNLANVPATGQYVWVLDDDDLCALPSLVQDVRRVAEAEHPAAIMVRAAHTEFGIIPHDATWGGAPLLGDVSTSNLIVRADVWDAYRKRFADWQCYAADYEFTRHLWQAGVPFRWLDIVAAYYPQRSTGLPGYTSEVAGTSPVRVLVFTPTFGAGPRHETMASVMAQRFAGSFVHEVSWHNPYPGADLRNVLAQFERGRALALAGGYDAMLTVEHDMRLPGDALQLLWDTGAPVAYGVYVLRHGAEVLNAWEKLPGNSLNMGESYTLRRDRLQTAIKQGVVPVSGVGFGCTLIRRNVMERIPFRSGGDGTEAPDMPFARDCLKLNLAQVAHFGVACGHWDGQRWLEALGGSTHAAMRVRANRNVTANIAGDTVRLVSGQEYELSDADTVLDLQRAGYITRM